MYTHVNKNNQYCKHNTYTYVYTHMPTLLKTKTYQTAH